MLTQGLGTEFSLTPDDVHGVCWIDDDDGLPAVQVFFAWNEKRLVTVRSDGDAAIAQVRQRVSERVDVLKQDIRRRCSASCCSSCSPRCSAASPGR